MPRRQPRLRRAGSARHLHRRSGDGALPVVLSKSPRCRRSDPRLDIGVHLVLTSEWQTYRWRPLTGASQASGPRRRRRLFLADGGGGARPCAPGRGRGRAPRPGRGGQARRHRHHPHRRAHVHGRLPGIHRHLCPPRRGGAGAGPARASRTNAYGNMVRGAQRSRPPSTPRTRRAAGLRPRPRDTLATNRHRSRKTTIASSTASSRVSPTWRSISTRPAIST